MANIKKSKTGKAAGRTPETLKIRQDIDTVIKECDHFQSYLTNVGAIGVYMFDTFTAWATTKEDMTDPKNHTKIMEYIQTLCTFRTQIRMNIIELYTFKDALKQMRNDIKNNRIENVLDTFSTQVIPKVQYFAKSGLKVLTIIQPIYEECNEKLKEVLPPQFINTLDTSYEELSKKENIANINVDTDSVFPEESVADIKEKEDVAVMESNVG